MLEKITRLIDERRLKQAQVERQCGLAQNRISNWKAGRGEPTARQLFRIASLLGVSMRYLVDDAMSEPAPEADEQQRIILILASKAGFERAIIRLMGLPETEKPPTAIEQAGAYQDVPGSITDQLMIETNLSQDRTEAGRKEAVRAARKARRAAALNRRRSEAAQEAAKPKKPNRA